MTLRRGIEGGSSYQLDVPDGVTTTIGTFESHARSRPDALAVSAGGRSLTYGELDRLANRVANAVLATRGSDREVVAFAIPQGIDAAVAVLGVLKTGKIRMSLDLQAPLHRQQEILRHAGAPVLLTDGAANAAAAAGLGIETLDVTSLPEDTPHTNPHIPIAPEAPATIYYTSGSTGRPKGVVTGHGAEAMARYLDLLGEVRVGDRFPLLYDLSFAAFSVGLEAAFFTGGSAHLTDIRAGGPSGIAKWLEEERITHLTLVPSLLQALLAELPEGENLPDLRTVSMGADRLGGKEVDAFRRRSRGTAA